MENTIYNQIGGKAFYMLGAKNIVGGRDNLSFKIGRNAKKITHITITLNSMDLYDIEYMNIRGILPIKIISESKNIYNDMLKKDIEENTGLYISL